MNDEYTEAAPLIPSFNTLCNRVVPFKWGKPGDNKVENVVPCANNRNPCYIYQG